MKNKLNKHHYYTFEQIGGYFKAGSDIFFTDLHLLINKKEIDNIFI